MIPRNKTVTKMALPSLLLFGAVVGLFIFFSNHQNQRIKAANQNCTYTQQFNHQIAIQNDKVSPQNTVAPTCDTLTITNYDDRVRLIAFGEHNSHDTYDGVGDKLLKKGQSLTITLIKAGSFDFHDHNQDEVEGTFSVTDRSSPVINSQRTPHSH